MRGEGGEGEGRGEEGWMLPVAGTIRRCGNGQGQHATYMQGGNALSPLPLHCSLPCPLPFYVSPSSPSPPTPALRPLSPAPLSLPLPTFPPSSPPSLFTPASPPPPPPLAPPALPLATHSLPPACPLPPPWTLHGVGAQSLPPHVSCSHAPSFPAFQPAILNFSPCAPCPPVPPCLSIAHAAVVKRSCHNQLHNQLYNRLHNQLHNRHKRPRPSPGLRPARHTPHRTLDGVGTQVPPPRAPYSHALTPSSPVSFPPPPPLLTLFPPPFSHLPPFVAHTAVVERSCHNQIRNQFHNQHHNRLHKLLALIPSLPPPLSPPLLVSHSPLPLAPPPPLSNCPCARSCGGTCQLQPTPQPTPQPTQQPTPQPTQPTPPLIWTSPCSAYCLPDIGWRGVRPILLRSEGR